MANKSYHDGNEDLHKASDLFAKIKLKEFIKQQLGNDFEYFRTNKGEGKLFEEGIWDAAYKSFKEEKPIFVEAEARPDPGQEDPWSPISMWNYPYGYSTFTVPLRKKDNKNRADWYYQFSKHHPFFLRAKMSDVFAAFVGKSKCANTNKVEDFLRVSCDLAEFWVQKAGIWVPWS